MRSVGGMNDSLFLWSIHRNKIMPLYGSRCDAHKNSPVRDPEHNQQRLGALSKPRPPTSGQASFGERTNSCLAICGLCQFRRKSKSYSSRTCIITAARYNRGYCGTLYTPCSTTYLEVCVAVLAVHN